jgi:circadian clock protein KaiB
MTRTRLRLFITGQTPRSARAVSNLCEICRRALADAYDIEIIDVLDRPDAADAARVVVTPTLIREAPPPGRRIIGDLSDRGRVIEALDLDPDPRPPRDRPHRS